MDQDSVQLWADNANWVVRRPTFYDDGANGCGCWIIALCSARQLEGKVYNNLIDNRAPSA